MKTIWKQHRCGVCRSTDTHNGTERWVCQKCTDDVCSVQCHLMGGHDFGAGCECDCHRIRDPVAVAAWWFAPDEQSGPLLPALWLLEEWSLAIGPRDKLTTKVAAAIDAMIVGLLRATPAKCSACKGMTTEPDTTTRCESCRGRGWELCPTCSGTGVNKIGYITGTDEDDCGMCCGEGVVSSLAPGTWFDHFLQPRQSPLQSDWPRRKS